MSLDTGAFAAALPSWSPATRRSTNGGPAKIIGESQQYLRHFSRIVGEETIAAGIATRMIELLPDWQNLRTLWYSASTAINRKHG